MNIYDNNTEGIAFPIEEELADLEEFFRIFGDRTRLQIMFHLVMQPEMGVNEIAGAIGMHQTAVSHQLKVLRHLRMVRYRKEGRNVYYRLSDNHIKDMLIIGMQHLQESEV